MALSTFSVTIKEPLPKFFTFNNRDLHLTCPQITPLSILAINFY